MGKEFDLVRRAPSDPETWRNGIPIVESIMKALNVRSVVVTVGNSSDRQWERVGDQVDCQPHELAVFRLDRHGRVSAAGLVIWIALNRYEQAGKS
jgi:hypothetical protein